MKVPRIIDIDDSFDKMSTVSLAASMADGASIPRSGVQELEDLLASLRS